MYNILYNEHRYTTKVNPSGVEILKTIIIDAHAKINLSLDVLGKKENGYHELSMIMQSISLKDIVTIRQLEDDDNNIYIKCNRPEVPTDHRNIVYNAFKIVSRKYNISRSIEVDIEKNIPISGGLAGGSTNAAAVLKGLNKLWNLELTQKELMEIGVEIGADVPFCIMGGTALSEGIGEKLTPLRPFKDKLILLANPGVEVSTADVYKNLNLTSLNNRPDIKKIISAIEEDDTILLAKNMKNVLESVTTKIYPQIEDIKTQMIDCGAIGSLMSGSGATVFGIFENKEKLENCKLKLEKTIQTVIIAKTMEV